MNNKTYDKTYPDEMRSNKKKGAAAKTGGTKTDSGQRDLILAALCVISVFLMETVLRLSCAAQDIGSGFGGFFYKLLLSVSVGLVIYFIAVLFRSVKARRIALIVIFAVLLVWFGTQLCMENSFNHYYTLKKLFQGGGDVAADKHIRSIGISVIFNHLPLLIILALPMLTFIFFGKRIIPDSTKPGSRLTAVGTSLAVYLLTVIIILNSAGSNNDLLSSSSLYKSSDFDHQVEKFGLMTATRLSLLGSGISQDKHDTNADILKKEENKEDTSGKAPAEKVVEKPVEYGYNKMDIDFAARAAEDTGTVRELDEYFAGITPSKQNKYTGMFKGKNMIFMTCEAFSPYFISEELTPTLYKMINSGIVLKNYYQPEWGYSTSDGEYSGVTGLVPEDGENSMKASAHNNMYFTLGSQFTRLGYYTIAHHNNTYTYYDRNLTHENLGYSSFVAYGNGLEDKIDKTWPESDLQMMQATVPNLIAHQPFHAYYMTVSGHCNYFYDGNYIANKNRDKVDHLNVSEPVRGYIACNLELEYAIEYLVDELTKAGILDDTVIVLNPDHYPYGLDNGWDKNDRDYYSELIAYSKGLDSYTVDQVMEIHKLGAIVWCSSIKEPIVVDEPVYSLDLLPTLSNLFGFEYDSRLLVGRDIFSDTGALVTFRNYSWITMKGTYNSKTKEFTPADGVTMTEAEQSDYVSQINSVVRNKVAVSAEILDTDYYGKLFD
ncbi:MAG: LTA synthase family protein [Clostridia bacterium]|nr:LTA synthase family protein [Clostridia bacterium]